MLAGNHLLLLTGSDGSSDGTEAFNWCSFAFPT